MGWGDAENGDFEQVDVALQRKGNVLYQHKSSSCCDFLYRSRGLGLLRLKRGGDDMERAAVRGSTAKDLFI